MEPNVAVCFDHLTVALAATVEIVFFESDMVWHFVASELGWNLETICINAHACHIPGIYPIDLSASTIQIAFKQPWPYIAWESAVRPAYGSYKVINHQPYQLTWWERDTPNRIHKSKTQVQRSYRKHDCFFLLIVFDHCFVWFDGCCVCMFDGCWTRFTAFQHFSTFAA